MSVQVQGSRCICHTDTSIVIQQALESDGGERAWDHQHFCHVHVGWAGDLQLKFEAIEIKIRRVQRIQDFGRTTKLLIIDVKAPNIPTADLPVSSAPVLYSRLLLTLNCRNMSNPANNVTSSSSSSLLSSCGRLARMILVPLKSMCLATSG